MTSFKNTLQPRLKGYELDLKLISFFTLNFLLDLELTLEFILTPVKNANHGRY